MPRARIGSRWTAILLALSLCLLVGLFVRAQQGGRAHHQSAQTLATAFVCPMHPDYTLDIAGSCPRCGMALVRGAPFDVRDYGLELTTEPAVVRAGQPARWRFRVSHPGTGERILNVRDRPRAAVSPLRDQSRHDPVSTHPSRSCSRMARGSSMSRCRRPATTRCCRTFFPPEEPRSSSRARS